MDELDVNKLYIPERITKTITTKEYKEKYINKEITMKACIECPNYSRNWACPEFKENAYRVWDEYDNIRLFLTKINFTNEALNTTYNTEELGYIIENTLFCERKNLILELEQLEKEYDGIYLSAGYCSYCDECARINNKPCNFPEKCRNSIESLGGLVSETLEEVFNEELKWINVEKGRLPENLSLLMALLY